MDHLLLVRTAYTRNFRDLPQAEVVRGTSLPRTRVNKGGRARLGSPNESPEAFLGALCTSAQFGAPRVRQPPKLAEGQECAARPFSVGPGSFILLATVWKKLPGSFFDLRVFWVIRGSTRVGCVDRAEPITARRGPTLRFPFPPGGVFFSGAAAYVVQKPVARRHAATGPRQRQTRREAGTQSHGPPSREAAGLPVDFAAPHGAAPRFRVPASPAGRRRIVAQARPTHTQEARRGRLFLLPTKAYDAAPRKGGERPDGPTVRQAQA